MRRINVWAYHSDFGTLCRNAKLDSGSGLQYPQGNTKGQAGWHVAVRFTSLDDLARKFSSDMPMPSQYCGRWFRDCDSIRRGEIIRLAIMAHGNQGGMVHLNGQKAPGINAALVSSNNKALSQIGLMTSQAGSTIILMGCLAGQGVPGTRLLVELSRVWPGRQVVGFSTVGYRHPGQMKRKGESCELPGMRDTDASAYLFANPRRFDHLWSDFKAMPWASETSSHAKVVLNGSVKHYPVEERRKTSSTAGSSPLGRRFAH